MANDPILVSGNASGAVGTTGVGEYLTATTDGRYVLFTSSATALGGSGSSLAISLFRKDMVTGTLLKVADNAASSTVSISDDGRYITYYDRDGFDNMLYDAGTGSSRRIGSNITGQTSTGTDEASFDVTELLISRDGSRLLFGELYRVTGAATGAGYAVVLSGSDGGGATQVTNQWAPHNSNRSGALALSIDYRYVAFQTAVAMVAGDVNSGMDVYRLDRNAGTVQLVSAAGTSNLSGTGTAGSVHPSAGRFMSGDGRYLAFLAGNGVNLLPADTDGLEDVYWKDMNTGELRLLTAEISSFASNPVSISDDGRYVAFWVNSNFENWVADAVTGVLARLPGSGSAGYAQLTADGTRVHLITRTALVTADNNSAEDVYRIDNPFVNSDGDDSLRGGAANDSIAAGAGNDSIDGRAGTDSLLGGDGNDSLTGGDGADSLSGGGGDDTLVGGTGNDSLDGGTGTDSTSFSGFRSAYQITTTAAGVTTIVHLNNGSDGTDIVTNVEQLRFADQTVQTSTTAPPTLTLADVSIAEGQTGTSALRFTLSLSHAAPAAASFSVSTADGTAVAGQDFTALTDQLVTIATGQSSATVTVTLTGDRLVEADERFTLRLSEASGLVFSGGGATLSATGTISNDDVGSAGADTLLGGAAGDLLSGLAGADSLDGGAGNDTLVGGTGNDTLAGGDGLDYAVFNGARGPYTVTGTTLVNGDDGVDTLSGIEIALFSDGQVLALDRAATGGSFNENYYLAANPDVAAAVQAGALTSGQQHFDAYGMWEGRDPSPFFSTAFYRAKNPDVAAVPGLSAWWHYLNYGWREGRDPSALFDSSGYNSAHPDVAAAGVNPLLHYLNYGVGEGRVAVVADWNWLGPL